MLRLLLSCLLLASIAFGADQAPPGRAGEVKAWAILFQMMDRLQAAVAQNELSAVHLEDPIASAAVSTLLAQAGESPTTKASLAKNALMEFVHDTSALHTAADAGNDGKCIELMKKVQADFVQLQTGVGQPVLEAAHRLADRFTCPMHPDVLGRKGDLCRKCGMPLDQRSMLTPSQSSKDAFAPYSVRATVETDAPLTAGEKAYCLLHLRRPDGSPVLVEDLIETHTRKIHLLIVDQSLTDYHHEHPRMTETPGDYVFEFTPDKPGSYLAWVDLRPTPLGLQEYERVVIAGTGEAERLTNRGTRLATEVNGLHFQLLIDRPLIKVAEPTTARLRVTRADGAGFDQLEPVMGAFAHLVGFNDDRETVLHLHPLGPPIAQVTARGGPELELKIFATKAGFTRLFAQVQVDGQQIFAPFAIQVLP